MIDERYSRQVLFAPVGPEGQRRIRASQVTLLGCGALGSTLANTLVRAGVGRLTIIDSDRLELSNLQRQTLFDEAQAAAGAFKAEAARERLAQINREVEVTARTERAGRDNLARLVGRPDLVLDATDNFATRYLLNDLCVRDGLAWIYGGCAAAYGVCMPVLPHETPCLRCLFPEPPPPEHAPTANTVGILAPIAHAVASLQAAEALKLLSGNRRAVRPVLYTLDLWDSNLGTVRLAGPEPDCPCCGAGRYDFLEGRR
ncbi:MAG TPA: ThiF family adenylyltransferase [Myxococcota bacterium]|nr:ThiF family adenylyltransferase [Myxococcota bacterium]HRY94401.1 ThiF family adenylyltransferase [Myxococcota bacterium]HSA22641.1 ThiF family adenylyltransferase [Myxococcota bacterium]